MKRFISAFLLMCILVGTLRVPAIAETDLETRELESAIASELAEVFDPDEYKIDVRTYYLSREYLEDMAFRNRQTNWFGYYLADIDNIMDGRKWVFTIQDGQTIYKEFEPYDDTYDIALRNVAIGTGIIVVCVTISVATAGAGSPAISAVFAASAKTAALHGVSSGAISGIISGVHTAIETDGDVEAVLKAAAREGSSAFLWGTVEGAIQGAATETLNQIIKLTPITKNVKDAIRDKTGWSDDILSQIGSTEEADIYQKANLREMKVNGRTMLVRTDINLNHRSELGGEMVTNLERMRAGYAPIDAMTGQKIQLHHVNQEPHGVLAMLTEAEHQGNAMILNREGKEGVQRLLGNSWNTERKNIWRAFAELMGDQ